MDNVNRTLYIPLYGKAYVSGKGLFLRDKKAEELWAQEGFALRGKSRSKWLAYYMGIRAAVFDDWTRRQLAEWPDAAIVQIGCGLDSRALRAGGSARAWYDVDFPEVIEERKRHFTQSPRYRMIAGDIRDGGWLQAVGEQGRAIVVMEGVSMYLTPGELRSALENICAHFESVALLTDCYTVFAAKMSRYRNPVNDVGVTQVHGLDDPRALESGALRFVREHDMTPQRYVDELRGGERLLFRALYAGGFAKKLYRLYEYRK